MPTSKSEVSERVEVRLLADFIDGRPIHEAVPAIKIGEEIFRLLASPGFAPGFACGDEIEAAPSDPMGYRIRRRAGNIAIQLFLFSCTTDDRLRIESIIKGIGGWLDGGSVRDAGHLLIFTIPAAVGFPSIENAMSRISDGFAVDRWMYGNVYDTKDGVTPLNWW